MLAADQRVTAWAKELRKAGVEGGMDALRARAYLDILLGMDSRPPGTTSDGRQAQAPAQPPGPALAPGPRPGPGPAPAPAPGPGGPLAGMIPPGFAGQVNLTIPAATLTGRADRPGELGGIGPVDPDPGANTWDRYQNRGISRPGIQHINVPDRCPRGSETGVRHVHRHAAATG